MTDNRGRTLVAEFSNVEVRVFEQGMFQNIIHIIENGDTVAIFAKEVDDLIAALQKAKNILAEKGE
jgi:hypothetical protein